MPIEYILTIVNAFCTVVISFVGFMLKRAFDNYDQLSKDVQSIKEKIAVILDRDRRRRLEDYQNEKGTDSDAPWRG